MRGLGGVDCPFCDVESFRRSDDFVETTRCFYASNLVGEQGVLPGSGIISPKAHRESPFELAPDEWADTHHLLQVAKALRDEQLRPDGYTLIWNVMPDGGQSVAHAHLHVIPRFHDEPYAGRGARWHLKQPENRRPDPFAPGLGRAIDQGGAS